MKHFLSQEHRQELTASGLTMETIDARGYITALTQQEAREMSEATEYKWKLTKNQLTVGGGLILPVYMDGGHVHAQIKPDKAVVRPDGSEAKYLSPAGMRFDGNGQIYDLGPGDLPDPATTERVIFGEGVKKGDALRQVFPNDLVVALQSPTAFLNTKSKLIRAGIWTHLEKYKGAQVFLCFDSDIASNPDVWAGVDKMRLALTDNDFKVKIVLIPPQGDKKAGIDDLLFADGQEAVKAAFILAQEAMPPSPKKDGRSKPKTAEEVKATDLLDGYMDYLDEQRPLFDDANMSSEWLKHRGEQMLFDTPSGTPYLLSESDRVYHRIRTSVPQAEVARWIQEAIEKQHYLKKPNPEWKNQGTFGQNAYRQAIRKHTTLTDKVRGVTKCRNVATLLAGHPDINTDDFCAEEYDRLLPLTGGQSIDFSKPFGSDKRWPYGCPLVETPHDARFTFCSPVTVEEYTDAANDTSACGISERFYDFLCEIAGADKHADTEHPIVTALKGFAGMCLHGAKIQGFFILYGPGRNGKGVFLRSVAFLFGAGVLITGAKAFIGRDRRHDAHWLDHRNRRLVLCADPAGYMNDSEILSYTGDDTVQGEVKGGDTIQFKPRGVLVFHGQADRIKFRVADDAMTDRIHAIKLTQRFSAGEQDSTLEKRLRDDAPMILCQLSELAHEYHKAINGLKETSDFEGQHTWRAGRADLLREANNFARFVDESVFVVHDTGEETDVTSSNIYCHYGRWCESVGADKLNLDNGDFLRAIQAVYPFVKARMARDEHDGGKRRRYYDGIYFADDTPPHLKDPDGDFTRGETTDWQNR